MFKLLAATFWLPDRRPYLSRWFGATPRALYPCAQYNLGVMYKQRQGVPADQNFSTGCEPILLLDRITIAAYHLAVGLRKLFLIPASMPSSAAVLLSERQIAPARTK
jgi:hypothetical protein